MAKLTIGSVDYTYTVWHEQCEQTIVCLHGFTGTKDTWAQFAEALPTTRIIAVDLIGHGHTSAPMDTVLYTAEAQVDSLRQFFDTLQLRSVILLGYSMGGRLALSFATRYPQYVEQLILESASPGLADDQARAERKEADDALAQRIEQDGVEAFVNRWENIPLFATQKHLPAAVQQAVRQERLSQRSHGLANSLRGFGTGVQPSNWHVLDTLTMPVLLLTGAHDEKFCVLAEKMEKHLENVTHLVIPDVGHAIHVENLAQFATMVKEAISLT